MDTFFVWCVILVTLKFGLGRGVPGNGVFSPRVSDFLAEKEKKGYFAFLVNFTALNEYCLPMDRQVGCFQFSIFSSTMYT